GNGQVTNRLRYDCASTQRRQELNTGGITADVWHLVAADQKNRLIQCVLTFPEEFEYRQIPNTGDGQEVNRRQNHTVDPVEINANRLTVIGTMYPGSSRVHTPVRIILSFTGLMICRLTSLAMLAFICNAQLVPPPS